jgi:hypothetical protein
MDPARMLTLQDRAVKRFLLLPPASREAVLRVADRLAHLLNPERSAVDFLVAVMWHVKNDDSEEAAFQSLSLSWDPEVSKSVDDRDAAPPSSAAPG